MYGTEFDIGEFIKKEQWKRRMTNSDLARKAGVTPQLISHYKKERRSPTMYTFLHILNALGKRMIIVDADLGGKVVSSLRMCAKGCSDECPYNEIVQDRCEEALGCETCMQLLSGDLLEMLGEDE